MKTILELTVRNHPGVMSHIAGLFARRGFNLDGIFCAPVGDATESRMWLHVREDDRLEQVIRQLERLIDVKTVRRADEHERLFEKVAASIL
ncbi:MAG TPA: acetolactate synthase small subunit [Opitutales bacterium]|nr:acetolactate synthase small subunit [Opitutales bacterium]